MITIDTPALGDRSYLVHDGQVAFDRTPIRDGETVVIGDRMRVTALATPGHTFTHLSYALDDAAMGATIGVFSGGSLLYGATGVFPTHGFGSFCSATQSDPTESTIGREKVANRVLTQDEETSVRELLAGLDDWPAYYAPMGPGNAAGHAPGTLRGESVEDITEAQREVVVLDVRRAQEYATARIGGAVNIALHDLPRRLDEVPTGEVWVHCAGGYRASAAASLLDAAGRRLVAVDDSFDNAREVGLHLLGPDA